MPPILCPSKLRFVILVVLKRVFQIESQIIRRSQIQRSRGLILVNACIVERPNKAKTVTSPYP